MAQCSNKYILFLAFCLVCILNNGLTYGLGWPSEAQHDNKDWPGKWFPQPPDQTVDDNPSVQYGSNNSGDLHDNQHGIKMGIPSRNCDDAKTNLTIDWDNSPINFTCFEDKHAYLPNLNIHPIFHGDHIPSQYSAPHRCMDTPIEYEENIPTFGPHRPLWPKYGEYIFLPRQRWLHSLEHGALVMLYHPCANKLEVQRLRKLVRGCLYRHIITPYTFLEPERPLALVTWGYRFEMSKVDPALVIKFIRGTALRGPEQKHQDGQFDFALSFHAETVSDQEDSNLCPNM